MQVVEIGSDFSLMLTVKCRVLTPGGDQWIALIVSSVQEQKDDR